jgi:hypothetical protein
VAGQCEHSGTLRKNGGDSGVGFCVFAFEDGFNSIICVLL